MPEIKNIFIIHQQGLDPLGALAKEAIDDLMDCFPEYKAYFPVANLGNWKSENCYVWRNSRFELAPYMSTDWFLQYGKEKAIHDGRWQTERKIDVDSIVAGLCNKESWIIFITKENLYQSTNGLDTMGKGFVNGACVLSVHDLFNRQNQLDPEIFKTLVQHEFGHILELTNSQRINTHIASGPHCLCGDCIMQQQSINNSLADMTEKRLIRRAYDQPPICPDCLNEGRKNLSRIYTEYVKSTRATSPIKKATRGCHFFKIPPTHS